MNKNRKNLRIFLRWLKDINAYDNYMMEMCRTYGIKRKNILKLLKNKIEVAPKTEEDLQKGIPPSEFIHRIVLSFKWEDSLDGSKYWSAKQEMLNEKWQQMCRRNK